MLSSDHIVADSAVIAIRQLIYLKKLKSLIQA